MLIKYINTPIAVYGMKNPVVNKELRTVEEGQPEKRKRKKL